MKDKRIIYQPNPPKLTETNLKKQITELENITKNYKCGKHKKLLDKLSELKRSLELNNKKHENKT